MGPAVVEQLVDRDLVRDVGDLYALQLAQWTELERMGEKSAANILEGLEQSRERTFDRVYLPLAYGTSASPSPAR